MEAQEKATLGSAVRRVGRWIRTYFMIVGLITTALMFGVWRAAMQYGAPAYDPVLASGENLVLHLKLSGQILEMAPDTNLLARFVSQFAGKPLGPYVADVRAELDRAAQDERVKGLFLEVQELGGSMAAFAELRQILAEFKQSGKPIQSWLASADTKTYYLASVGDQITMGPVGELAIPGPAFQLVYFGDALRKLGVDIEVVRAGKFKSAFEPFILNKPSPESTVMYQSLEESLRGHLSAAIQEGRKLDELGRVTQWFEQSLYTPASAKDQGLVDAIAYVNEARDVMASSLQVKVADYALYMEASQPIQRLSEAFTQQSGIALIEANGEIHMSARGDGEGISPEHLNKELVWAREEGQVKAVVLRISSPGGSATASDLIWEEVRRLAAKKPVVVSMAGYAASGGYYIAAPASKIYALPTTITGSIGVIGMIPNLSAFEEKYGISFHMITVSERKNLLNPGSKATTADKALLAASIDEVYQAFVNKVATGRSLGVEQVDAVAQGRVWTGAQAKGIGLVDELGGLYEAIQEAKRLANMDPAGKVPLLRWQPPIRTFSDCLSNVAKCFPAVGASLASVGLASALPATKDVPLQGLWARLSAWLAYLPEEPVQAIWPGYFSSDFGR